MFQQIEDLPMDDSTNIELREYVFKLISTLKPEICVEIGTHRGITALYIAEALKANDKGFLITTDPTDYGFTSTLNSFPHLKPYVEYRQIKGTDLNVSNIDFLFVDGFHEYDAVLAEINYFLPRLNSGAHVLFHDCGGDSAYVGVNQAIDKAGLKTELLDFNKAKSRLYIHDFSHNPIN